MCGGCVCVVSECEPTRARACAERESWWCERVWCVCVGVCGPAARGGVCACVLLCCVFVCVCARVCGFGVCARVVCAARACGVCVFVCARCCGARRAMLRARARVCVRRAVVLLCVPRARRVCVCACVCVCVCLFVCASCGVCCVFVCGAACARARRV